MMGNAGNGATPTRHRSSRAVSCVFGVGRWVALVAMLAATLPSASALGQEKKADAKGATIKAVSADKAPTKAGGKPIATFDNTTHDWGEVWIGPDLKHGFKITNTGDAVLNITKVRPP